MDVINLKKRLNILIEGPEFGDKQILLFVYVDVLYFKLPLYLVLLLVVYYYKLRTLQSLLNLKGLGL
jgi:hypothetical protein